MKYSKYNVYTNCTHMYTFAEANVYMQGLLEDSFTCDDIALVELRVGLYNKFFQGFSNSEETKQKYYFLLRKLYKEGLYDVDRTDVDKAKDRLRSAEELAAEEEFKERISSIDFKLKTDAKTNKEIPSDIYNPKIWLTQSRHSKMNNYHIPNRYKSDDTGIYCYDKGDMFQVSSPISIKMICFDSQKTMYLVLEYLDFQEEINSVVLSLEEIYENQFIKLVEKGAVIHSRKMLTDFLNKVVEENRRTNKIPIAATSDKYGYLRNSDGSYDYNRFIGIDDENRILSTSRELKEIDNVLMKPTCNVDEYLEKLDYMSRGDYTIDFQLIVAASLAGITLARLNQNVSSISPPTYLFTGHTSIGKTLLCKVAELTWAKPCKNNPLTCTSGSSVAFFMALKHHLECLPLLVSDVQDLINAYGINACSELIFSHSNGVAGGRANSDGTIRSGTKNWANPLILFAENDFTGSRMITGGTAARYCTIPLNVPKGSYVTQKPPSDYIEIEEKYGGILGVSYVKRISTISNEAIEKMYRKYKDELLTKKVPDKISNSLALLQATLELMKKVDLLPSAWNIVDTETLLKWVGIRAVDTPSELVYETLCSLVLRDDSFVSIEEKLSESDFKIRQKTPSEVRGRLLYQKKNCRGEWEKVEKQDRDRTLLLIPSSQLTSQLKYIVTNEEIVGFHFNQKEWFDNGWLLKPEGRDTYLFKNSVDLPITRVYDSKARENYYSIVIKEDSEMEVKTEAKTEAEAEVEVKTETEEVSISELTEVSVPMVTSISEISKFPSYNLFLE